MGKGDCIACCMKHQVIFSHPEATVRAAAGLMAEHSIETLPVVDGTLQLVGVITMRDVVEIFLPDFVSLVPNIGFVKDFGDWGTPSRQSMQRAESLLVADIMREPVSVEGDCTLIRALSLLHKHRIRDLVVVKEGRPVGIASHVDIGRAYLYIWLKSQHDWTDIHCRLPCSLG